MVSYVYGKHIELDVQPRYLTRRSQREREPTQFRVLLRKRFYSHRVADKVTILRATDTFDDAVDHAHEYMAAFVMHRRTVAMETRKYLESDPVMAAKAEEVIITEAATSAAIHVAGYSDDLLLNDLQGLLEFPESTQLVLQAVVHRDGQEYDTVFVAEGFEAWGQGEQLQELYKEFDRLNEQKFATTLAIGELRIMMGVFDETRVIRYLASEDEETLIFIHPKRPLHVPPFERQIADLVDAKWNRA